MNNQLENGTRQNFDGKECIYFDGYWIRYYPEPTDTLANRKVLIDSLTRRAFHHTETGINTPGERLDEARRAFDKEKDPCQKRINGAMLAGALFNRATDIFTAIVDLEAKGVAISHGNELMQQCSNCFKEALELGKYVKHYSGQEGIDELWGEPFKAFSQPIGRLFESRYRKIAQTMRDIDQISEQMTSCFEESSEFKQIPQLFQTYSQAAKLQIETMKSDGSFFEVWPAFVSSREKLEEFEPNMPPDESPADQHRIRKGVRLVREGTALITYLSEARVPMPKSTYQFLLRCEECKQKLK